MDEPSTNVPPKQNDGEVGCPACGSNQIHRSRHSNRFERVLLRLVGVRPYRCESCAHRFYSRRKEGGTS